MNVTELARRLKIPTTALRDLIPSLGFDIGKKAIKIDERVAEQITEKIKSKPGLLERIRRGQLDTLSTPEEEVKPKIQSAGPLLIPQRIRVRDFAELLHIPVTNVVKELMNNGILASLNEQIDFETASIIAEDLGYTVQLRETATLQETTVERLLEQSALAGIATDRPPVVVVMGHVDHGKTKLLDAIRKTDVVAGEAGGITQHIGAYQVIYKDRPITFIDTPGHEAFSTMRSRGARVADIAILVVAADEGIKPQTEEAIKIIQSSELPFVVAINKIDKEGANIERIKQQLAEKNLLPEDWGGKVITVPISAKQIKGIGDLLDTLLLVADFEKEGIKANPEGTAIGTIIESHIDKGEGNVATVLIQSGTLQVGDMATVGSSGGKIKSMRDYRGEEIMSAGPSTPVKIIGLKSVPAMGEILQVQPDLKSLKKTLKEYEIQRMKYEQGLQTASKDEKDMQTFNIILKTDTIGSQEAIIQSLEHLALPDFRVEITHKGLGNITESDLETAQATGSFIYGFHVLRNPNIEESALERNVTIRLYKIIYELIQDVQQEAEKILSPEIVRIEEGRIKVLAIFRTEKKSMIIGGTVTKGKAVAGAQVRVIRNEEEVCRGKITELQSGKQSVRFVPAVADCGIQYEGPPKILQGDFLEVFREEKHYRKLNVKT